MCFLRMYIIIYYVSGKPSSVSTLTRGAQVTSASSKDKGSQKSHSKRTGTDQSRQSNDVS